MPSPHLKSVVTYLGNGTIVVAPDFIDTNSFAIENVIFTDRNEIRAANCLRINQHLLIARGNPATEKRLRDFAEQNDVTVVVLDLSEFEKGDGSLTCLSLIW
jgi:dimethylargininase